MTWLAWVGALLAPFWQWIAGGIGIIGTLWVARRAGKTAERAAQLQRDANARSEADHIEDAVAGRTAAENRRRLSKWVR